MYKQIKSDTEGFSIMTISESASSHSLELISVWLQKFCNICLSVHPVLSGTSLGNVFKFGTNVLLASMMN